MQPQPPNQPAPVAGTAWPHTPSSGFLCCPECGCTDLHERPITTDTGRDCALECDNCGEAYPT